MTTRPRPHRLSGRAAALGCVLALLATAACGSKYDTAELLAAQGASNTAATPEAGPGTGSAATTTLPAASSQETGTADPAAPSGGPAPATGAGTPSAAGPAATATSAKAGAPLVVGQVGAWSGLVGQSAGNGRTGLAVWARDVNARGGLACHPVQVFSVDDQSDGSKSSAAVNDLVQNKKVQALVASFVPIVSGAYTQAVNRHEMPTVGGDYVSADWLSSPYMFGVGGAPEAVYTATLKGAAVQGKKKVAIWYCVEAAACSYGRGFAQQNAGVAGVTIVDETTISLTQSDFTSQCQNAKNAQADAIFYFGDGSSVQRLARSCNNLQYNPTILVPSLAAIAALRTDPNTNKGGMVFSPSVFPWMLSDTPARKAFQDAYARYAPGSETDAAAATAWASGKMLEAAIAKLGQRAVDQPITTAMILEGLGLIRDETLGGLIPPTTYRAGQQSTTPVRCAYVAILSEQRWRAQSSEPQCL